MGRAVGLWLAIGLALAAVAAARSGPGPATTSTIDAGPAPMVTTWVTLFKPERPPELSVRARPRDTIAASGWVHCSRGKGDRTRRFSFYADAPVHRKIKLPFAGPTECDLSADVSYAGWQASEGRWGKLTATFVP